MTEKRTFDLEKLAGQVGRYLDEMQALYGPYPAAGAVAGGEMEEACQAPCQAPLPPAGSARRGGRKRLLREDAAAYRTADSPSERDLKDLMGQLEETFQERLFRLIRERDLDETKVYKRAGLDRKLFSKIRCSRHYRPGKETVLALCLSMELSMDESRDLLARAGLALSPSSRSDLIVGYCIEHEIYDLMLVNALLDRFGEACLSVS